MRDANHGPRAPLAALIQLLNRALWLTCGLIFYLETEMYVYYKAWNFKEHLALWLHVCKNDIHDQTDAKMEGLDC